MLGAIGCGAEVTQLGATAYGAELRDVAVRVAHLARRHRSWRRARKLNRDPLSSSFVLCFTRRPLPPFPTPAAAPTTAAAASARRERPARRPPSSPRAPRQPWPPSSPRSSRAVAAAELPCRRATAPARPPAAARYFFYFLVTKLLAIVRYC
jgi:hypothetical protein